MRWAYALGAGGVAFALVAIACGGDDASPGAAPSKDAGPGTLADAAPPPIADAAPDVVDSGPVVHTIAIHVSTVSASFSRGGPANATWAAKLDDATGGWTTFAPNGADAGTGTPGEYEIGTEKPSFSVAFACADTQTSLVSVFTRATNITDLDVVLGSQCGTEDTNTTDLTGTISNAPPDTGWLDFGYPFDVSGAVFPTNNGTGDYELVNIVAGTWDTMFGFRDDGFSLLSKLAIVRAHTFAPTTATFNLDVAASGFTPGKQTASLTSLASEDTHVHVLYTLGGTTSGIDVGPGNDPTGVATASVAYATVPAASQAASDRYRASFIAQKDQNSTRGATATFHTAADFAVDLPAAIAAPTASVVGTRIGTKVTAKAGATLYEASVFTRVSNQSTREWRVSIDGSLVTTADVDLTPPDFAAVAGFDPTWNTPAALEHTVTGTVHEASSKVGDGTLDPYASEAITMSP